MADISMFDQVKDFMEYDDGSRRCENCAFFVPTDCSGNHNAKLSHCTRNAFELPVVPQGSCKEYIQATKK